MATASQATLLSARRGPATRPGVRVAVVSATAMCIALALFDASWFAAGILERGGYSAARDYISELSALTARHAWVMGFANGVCGLCTLAFAWLGLRPALRGARGGTLAAAAIGLSALGFDPLADVFFRLDCRTIDGCTEIRQMSSWHGAAHGLVGVVTALALVAAPHVVARALRGLPAWRDQERMSVLFGVLIDVAALGNLIPGYGGLAQRLMLVLGSIWLVVLAQRVVALEDAYAGGWWAGVMIAPGQAHRRPARALRLFRIKSTRSDTPRPA